VLLGNCVKELCVRCVTGELRYRIVCEACYRGTVIELWVRGVTGELCYRIVCEACYWGTEL